MVGFQNNFFNNFTRDKNDLEPGKDKCCDPFPLSGDDQHDKRGHSDSVRGNRAHAGPGEIVGKHAVGPAVSGYSPDCGTGFFFYAAFRPAGGL